MIRTDDGHEKENLPQESMLYFDSQEQADAFVYAIRKNDELSEALEYENIGNGKVRITY